MVVGFTDEDEEALVDWKTDNTPRGEEPKTSRKGKERVSSGGAGDGVASSSTQKSGKKREKSNSGGSGGGNAKLKRRSHGEEE